MHLNFDRFFRPFFKRVFSIFERKCAIWASKRGGRETEQTHLFLTFSGLGPSWGPGPSQRASKTDFDIIFNGFSVICGWILASIFERFVMFHRQVFSEKKARGGIGA